MIQRSGVALPLVLVRHGPVRPDPAIPSATWPLTGDGRHAVRALVPTFATLGIAQIVTSPEVKARQTAAVLALGLGVPFTEDERLREVRMDTGFLPAAEFQRRIREYLAGTPDADFETQPDAVSRVVSLLHDHRAGVTPTAIVSHGRLLALLTAALLPGTNPSRVWLSMGFPDWALIDPAEEAVLRPFGGGAPLTPR